MLSDSDKKLLLSNAPLFISYYSGLKLKDFHVESLEVIDQYPRSIVLYFAGGGKALALDTPVKTASGWKTMESLVVGDLVFRPDGTQTPVIAKSPVWRDRPCWDVGGVIADEEHEWMAWTEDYWGERVTLTPDLHTKRGRKARIRISEPLQYQTADLPLDPWLLGFWLGDGHSANGRITVGGEDWDFISRKVVERGYALGERNSSASVTVLGVVNILRKLGVINNKHIPPLYMTAGENQRRQLLQGLIDSDGYVDPSSGGHTHPGRVEFCSTNRTLAKGALELIRSLGMRAEMSTGAATLDGRYISEKYRIHFYGENVASIPRKADKLRAGRYQKHYVRAVPVEPRDTQCIQVLGGMFLAGERLIPTRNSTLITKWYSIYKIAQNRNVRQILGLKSDKEKDRYARAIRQELAGNHRLITDFGRFAPRGRDIVWSNDAIEVEGREITEPTPTILFATSTTIDQVLGARCDIAGLDDIVTPSTVSTQQQRDKQWSLVNEGIETGPQYIWDRDPRTGRLLVPSHISWPEGIEYEKLWMAGTVFHPDDLFHRKIGKIADMKNGVLYKKVKDPKYVAIKYDIWRDYEKREPMWPERWTPEKIDLEEKSVGSVSFNRRRRNIAIDEGSMVFRRAWIYGGMDGSLEFPGCLDRTRSFGEMPENPYIVMGLDPSTGRKGKGTSWSSFVIMAVNRTESPQKRYIVDVFRKQMGFDDIVSYMTLGDEAHGIEGFFTKYHYHEGRVEANAAQTYLIDNARVREAGLQGCRIMPHETQNKNRNDPLTGVSSMQRMVKDGLLSIPYKNPSDREQAQEFIDQLLMFPEGTDDYCLALWFAEIAIRGLGSKYKAYGPNRGDLILNPRFQR